RRDAQLERVGRGGIIVVQAGAEIDGVVFGKAETGGDVAEAGIVTDGGGAERQRRAVRGDGQAEDGSEKGELFHDDSWEGCCEHSDLKGMWICGGLAAEARPGAGGGLAVERGARAGRRLAVKRGTGAGGRLAVEGHAGRGRGASLEVGQGEVA